MKKAIFKNVLMIVLTGLTAFAVADDFRNVGHSGGNFLQIPVEPAGAALGNALVAKAYGVDGLYWNPGAIAFSEGTEILLSTADWIIDTRLSYLGITHYFPGFGTVGLGITAFTMDDMEITTELEPTGTGEFFDAGNYAFGLSYGIRLTDRFSFGGSVKFIYEFIWETDASAIAFDFGSVYRSGFYGLRIGMRLANFGGDLSMSGDPIDNKPNRIAQSNISFDNDPRLDRIAEEYSLPQLFNVGIALDPYATEQHRFTILSAINDPNDNDTRINFGGEYAFQEIFFLRMGYKSGYEEQDLSFGLGAKLNISGVRSQFDYGFNNFGILGDIHYLSFRVGL